MENHHFETLVTMAQDLNLHIHDVEFGTILLSGDGDVFWVCGHCDEQGNQDSAATAAPDAASPDETVPEEVVASTVASAAL